MKKIFRKAVTVLGSAGLIGMTVGMAAAASYPQPFTSNSAVVVGATAAPSDLEGATDILNDLTSNAAPGSLVVTGDGDSYTIEDSDNFHLGDSISDVIGAGSSINEDDMPTILAEGEYTDKDNDNFDYSQKIVMNDTLALSYFEDSDYERDVPTIGMFIDKDQQVLTYTFTFDDEPVMADLETTDLPLMGQDYYVLDVADTNDKITLLDAADDAIIAEGESTTVTAGGKTYTVNTEFVGSSSVKLNINGEITNALSAGSTYKLDDGSYVGIKEILYSSKDTGVSKVEFSIGNGKLILEDGQLVELNEVNIDGLTATIVNASADISSISLTWTVEEETFVTTTSEAVMPGFETLKLNFGGIEFPAQEKIVIENDGDDSIVLSAFPLKDTTEDINIAWFNSTSGNYSYTGAESDILLSLDGTYDGDTDEWALLTWNDTDEAESYLVRATNFNDVDNDGSKNETTIQVRENGAWKDVKSNAEEGDDFTIGNLDITIGAINVDDETIVFHGADSNSTLYSAEGMAVDLAQATGAPTWTYVFTEEDEDENLASGAAITVVIGDNADDEADVDSYSVSAGSGAKDTTNSDITEEYTYSMVPTMITSDASGDQDVLSLVYSGSEAIAKVYLNSAEATTSGDAGIMSVKDTDVATVAGKNLVVVGGSCINSVAAELLGGQYCEAAFTANTGVGAGEFLIGSYKRTSGETALLVAGYAAGDTVKAVTYLLNNDDIDTTVGMKMKGTSATEEAVVIE